jgi:hypothetical protein
VNEAEEKARNKAVVSEFFERMNAGDLGGSFSLLADDCAWFSLSSRKFSGKEQMRAMIANVNEEMLAPRSRRPSWCSPRRRIG